MSDNNDLIPLNCPNCQAPLSCRSTEMVLTCEHCGASILVKDFITGSRINNNDRLQSYLSMAENSLKIKDWKNAYKYYESICKITKSNQDLIIFNALGYICGKIEFRNELATDCRKLEAEKRILLLNEMKIHTDSLKSNDVRIVSNSTSNPKTRKAKINSIIYKYAPTLNILYNEIQATKPINCICGNVLQCDDETCSKCGKSKTQILEEIKNKNKHMQKVKNLLIAALAFMFLSIIFGASTINNLHTGKLSSATPLLIITAVLLTLSILILNKKLKNIIIDSVSQKIPFKNKKDLFKDKITNIFLPLIIIVPIAFMLFIGLFIISDNPNKNNDSSNSSIIQTTETTEPSIEPPTEDITKIATKALTKSSTEKVTEEPTEESESTEQLNEEITKEETEEPAESKQEEVDEAIDAQEEVKKVEEEPVVEENPDDYVTVYYTKTGEKYHYENPCGRGTYYECTLSEAKRRGLTPCEKCVLH